MSKTAIIFGINGMDGSHMADFLLDKGYTVYGVQRKNSKNKKENIFHIKDKIIFLEANLRNTRSILKCLKISNPDEVYNLASEPVGISWKSPESTSDINALGTLRILESIRKYNQKIKFYQASSSEMFGRITKNPANETTPFYPKSPYGVCKLYSHWTTINYREIYKMFAVSGILFNHESERRKNQFVTKKISNGIAKIYLGLENSIILGNIDIMRDWGYAPDYVEAMWLMMQQETPQDFVIATGETHSIREFLDEGFKLIGISNWQKYVIQDKKFMRPAELDILVGDCSKAEKILGWKSKTSFKELVKIMVMSEIDRVKSNIK